MLILLVMLAVLIPRVRDARIWGLLTDRKAADYQPQKPATPVVVATPLPATVAIAQPSAAEDELALDQEPEEQEAFKEEAEVLLDRRLEVEGIEMVPYWRVVRWAIASSFENLQKRASRSYLFNDFVRKPNKMRGQLVRLRLNVRRVLQCERPPSQPKDIPQLYEIWGATDQSQAWLYCIITPELPPGLPVGPSVHEEVVFTGFFLKLQGYQPGNAKPNDSPLFAPLLIGKLQMAQPLPPAQADTSNWWWLAVGGLAVAGFAAIWYVVHRSRPHAPIQTVGGAVALPWQQSDDEDADELGGDSWMNNQTDEERIE